MKVWFQRGEHWFQLKEPVRVLMARTEPGVRRCLKEIEESELWAAGFITYEASAAFDSSLKTHRPGKLPLLCFGLFERLEKARPPVSEGTYELGSWTPSVSRDEYSAAIASVKERIAAGDTYQVNYTFRLNADFAGDPFALFCDLTEAQQANYGVFIETDDFAVCSASPELFFELYLGTVTSKPMKGTRPRGMTAEQDRAAEHDLQNATKDRAENIMIVDMIRNDIGRIAIPGTVQAVSQFDVEKYPTVWQMTSTVTGESFSRVSHVLEHLFPCASITGAPKAKTMEIIQELETTPRGIYTGAAGFIAPDGSAQFNVAIRTAMVDKHAGRVTYGIGGGIVWDSDADAEYEEALSKAAILTRKMPEFQLLETMLYEPGKGIFLLKRHMERLAESAEYFGFSFNPWLEHQLERLAFDQPMRIRVVLDPDGFYEVQELELPDAVGPVRLAVAGEPVSSKNVFLYHKTTHRADYERAKAASPDADDVLLYNERGEVTESCIANIVVELDGKKVTPPVSCGLLGGTLRAELLAAGEITEQIITLDDLKRADAVWLINSVRKWRPAQVIFPCP